jgi:hypothetical protein
MIKDWIIIYVSIPIPSFTITSVWHNRIRLTEVRSLRTVILTTCATQLVNAGCRITSIQKFLGHTRLNSTLTYARVHDETVAKDYYTSDAVNDRLSPVKREFSHCENSTQGLSSNASSCRASKTINSGRGAAQRARVGYRITFGTN